VKERFEMGRDSVPAFLTRSRREVDLGPSEIFVAQEIERNFLRGEVLSFVQSGLELPEAF